jgi:transcriptional regulator with XRE-family HTH domain
MDETQIKYNGQFTIEERKAMTAEALRELRKYKKLSQKEVAAYLNIPATTYNTYESGRTEPPIEILVRLSHLYAMSIDMIVQRDRTYRTANDVASQMAECREQIEALEKQIADSGNDASTISGLIEVMGKLTEAMTAYSQTEAAQKAINLPESD